MQKLLISLSVISLGLSALPVFAQTTQMATTSATALAQDDPMVPYRAYREAVEKGELNQAATQAARAWQLAETKWGATNPNTAGLAYNAAWSAALIGKSAERLDAARRAVELAPQARESYDVKEAQFLLAYSEYFATKPEDRPKEAAKLAAAALPVETTWTDYLVVNALVQSLTNGMSETRGRQNVALADRTLAVIDRVAPNDKNARALTLLARGQARLLARVDTEEAVADLVQARVAYGYMRQPDDLTWGALGAWEMTARSIALTNDAFTQSQIGTRITRRTRRPLSMTEAQSREIMKNDANDTFDYSLCEGVKRNRRFGSEITYPAAEISALRVAGVMVRTDFTPDGRTTNVRLLGAVPTGAFGNNALAAVRTWRYTIPPNTPVQCMQNRDIGVSFALG
jgi:TonB family protein